MSIKIIACIHPFSTEKIEKEVEVQSIREIYASLDPGLSIDYCYCQVSGHIITDFDYIPRDGDDVMLRVFPRGTGNQMQNTGIGMKAGGSALIVGGALLAILSFGTLAAVGAGLIGAGIGMLAGGVILYNTEIPGLEDSNHSPKTRPGLKGSRNTSRYYGYVPVLFGKHLVVPDFAANPFVSIENNEQYLTQLFCAGYNNMAIDMSSFRVGDTLLTELSTTKDINKILAGEDDRITMELLSDGNMGSLYPHCVSSIEVNQQVKQTLTDGSSGAIVRTTPDKTSKIDINLSFPQGLFGVQNGTFLGTLVLVNLYIKPADAPDSEYEVFGYVNGKDNVVLGQTKESLYYSVSKTVAPGKWTIKIEKIDSNLGGTRYETLYLLSINAIREDEPVFPAIRSNLQLIALKLKATDVVYDTINNFNFIAESRYLTYSGSGSGSSAWTINPTQNPASAMLYALQGAVNRKPVENKYIDWPAFEQFYKWCEEQQYYCCAYMSDKMTLVDLLKQIALTGRTVPTKKDGLFSLIQDIKRPAPMQLLTPKNTINYSETILFPEIPHVLDMQFVSEEAGWVNEIRSVYNTPTGEQEGSEAVEKQEVNLWGITHSRQAFLMGRYNYACSILRPRQHVITLDFEYLMAQKGDWIKYSGDMALRGIAWGRIKDLIISNNIVSGFVLDEYFDLDGAKTYKLRVRNAKNEQQLYDIISVDGYFNYVNLMQPVSVSSSPKAGDLFVLGESESIDLDLIIMDIEPLNELKARLKCTDYSPEIFGIDNPDYIIPPWTPHVSVGGTMDSGVSGNPPPAYIKDLQNEITNISVDQQQRPTYSEIVNGFTAAGATVLPEQLTLAAAGGFRFINISWNKQTSLSNLKLYQLQVSEDTETWYAPRFDGVDWKGNIDGFFETTATMVVHPNIPPKGTEENPEGRFLYYRVRQLTMKDEYSDWSTIVGAQTKLADTGDYGVNSISANALKAAELFALFATLGETLIIDPSYGISSETNEWAEGDTRAVLNSKEISFQYFLRQQWNPMVRLGLAGLESTQVYSKDKLYITNNDMVSRRQRGYDIGIPYLSGQSRVAHFDTDMLDQYGQEMFTISGIGTLVNDQQGIPIILKATAPYATDAKALYGNFRIQKTIAPSDYYTFDFWMLYHFNEDQTLFSLSSGNEILQIQVKNDEPYYNSDETDDMLYNYEPTDDIWYNQIAEETTQIGRYNNGVWSYINILNDDGTSGFINDKWYHVALVKNGSQLFLYINNSSWGFPSQSGSTSNNSIDINETVGLFIIDEFMVDPVTAENNALFKTITRERIPWGSLDYQKKWTIFDVADPAYFKSNIFQSQDFKDAVQEIITNEE